ncbi:DNA ligase D-like protein (predicted polymerase) [Solirubrobacter pauli]|uniref:DNA ligase D-like protein (Predicted polymerase) n=1 Tax=Solirubrobacter pauli TaxID=166793 RepID=A0A660LHU2_9ACTN|nr:ATP-dependent DNA ligase [Solirubrobacter pauli]RKQ93946.1 DNA ligase D-like protein (predicted polymerase) [Solirubrobacter pauli]
MNPDDVALSSLDSLLFDGAEATKGDLVAYLDAVADRLIAQLSGRPLSVMRVRPGQKPFMQKNLPKGAPDWIERVGIWAETSKREVHYALCNDAATLRWFANQRAVEYHPSLYPQRHLVLDLDPPAEADFAVVAQTALLVREALSQAGLSGAIKTSGSKGVHIFVPVTASGEEIAHATRALAKRAAALDPSIATIAYVVEEREGKVFVDSTRAGGGTVVAAYSPRIRPGVPVSFPIAWDDVERVSPADFTIRTAPGLLGDADPWLDALPEAQPLPADLVEEGRAIPIARVAAMHEGKRRKRAAGT